MKSFYMHRVLDSDLPKWTAQGWIECGRDRVPSVDEDIVIIEKHETERFIDRFTNADYGRSWEGRHERE